MLFTEDVESGQGLELSAVETSDANHWDESVTLLWTQQSILLDLKY